MGPQCCIIVTWIYVYSMLDRCGKMWKCQENFSEFELRKAILKRIEQKTRAACFHEAQTERTSVVSVLKISTILHWRVLFYEMTKLTCQWIGCCGTMSQIANILVPYSVCHCGLIGCLMLSLWSDWVSNVVGVQHKIISKHALGVNYGNIKINICV